MFGSYLGIGFLPDWAPLVLAAILAACWIFVVRPRDKKKREQQKAAASKNRSTRR